MESDATELRLFLETLACDLFFFEHLDAGVAPEAIDIHQEVDLGPRAFADIRVQAGDAPPYFVEIDTGYTPQRLLESVKRKYGIARPASDGASRLIIVTDGDLLRDRTAVERGLRAALRSGLELELWDEHRLLDAAAKRFGVRVGTLREEALLDLRAAIDRAKGTYAFGEGFQSDSLEASLLWHLAPWKIRRLREGGRTSPRAILPPGLYPEAVVLMADICSYSSYVRDTKEESVSRRALTSYASKTRYQVLSDGGMLYQFLGDSVVGLFGIPERTPDYVEQALRCACRLVDIGASVAAEWQRDIDQIQSAAGVHIALTIGDLQVLSLRPFSRTHMGVVGDSINLCARLNGVAGCDEIVVSNMFYRAVPDTAREGFEELPPVEAKNVGRLRAWKLGPLRILQA